MDKILKFNNLNNLTDEISKHDHVSYDDLPSYDLFLSQVIDLLNDKFSQDEFTSNIVQNYIKNEVIMKPEDGKKRGYTKTHLVQLILLGYMRPVLSTEEIKKVFKLAFNDINNEDDDILSWEETFKIFIQMQNESFNQNLMPSLNYEAKVDEMIKEFNLKDTDENRIRIFLLVLSLVADASAIKRLVQKIIEEYSDI
jgi:hypothetical protein